MNKPNCIVDGVDRLFGDKKRKKLLPSLNYWANAKCQLGILNPFKIDSFLVTASFQSQTWNPQNSSKQLQLNVRTAKIN